MATRWLLSRFSAEGRFFRHLRDGRWDKLVPSHQQDMLAEFITCVALTPGQDEVVLRCEFRGEKVEYLWAIYEIMEADTAQCQLRIRALCVPEAGSELRPPSGYEDVPFFAVEPQRSSVLHKQGQRAA